MSIYIGKDHRSPEEQAKDFQTPLPVCEYMTSMIPFGTKTVLEPSPGEGNMISLLQQYELTAPKDFFVMPKQQFDCVVMNPPFSERSCIMTHAPKELQDGLRVGFYFLTECMKMSDNIIALMPWFTLTDSDVRRRMIREFGLISVTSLPRKTFKYARIQTCVLQMKKGHTGKTLLKEFNF